MEVFAAKIDLGRFSDFLHAPVRLYLDHFRSEFLAILHLEFLPESWRKPMTFAVRGWISCVTALFIAYYFQLDEPYWAGMSAWLAMQPTSGMTLSKGYYRILGSIVGAAMGVVLIAFFAQSPDLFILAFALWMGLCTLAANLLTNFRMYGAITAGFTAGIVSLSAYTSPNKVLDIAMSRGSATIIGIICTVVITAIFVSQGGREKVLGLIRQAISTTARRGAIPFDSSLHDRIAIGKPLIASLIGLEAEIEFAAVESAEFRIHSGLSRSLVAHLFGVISEKRSLEDHLKRVGMIQTPEALVFLNTTIKILEDAPALIDANEWEKLLTTLREHHLHVMTYDPPALDMPQAVSTRFVLDRLCDLLLHYERVIVDWMDIQGGWRRDPNLSLNFHRDKLAATIHATRAMLAVIGAGIVWIATAWSSGALMLTQLAVISAFFSYVPKPEVQSFNFFKGSLLAAITAFICTYYVLPHVDDFLLFALVQGIFLVPGATVILNPKYSGIGFAYCVVFMVIERPLNPPDYDIGFFLNNALATILGCVGGIFTYLLIVPDSSKLSRWYVVRRTRRGLMNIAGLVPIPPSWTWQTRMFDRINRLYNPDKPPDVTTDESYEGSLGALSLGNDMLRLRHLIQEGKLDKHVCNLAQSIVESFDMILSKPDLTVRASAEAAYALRNVTPPAQGERYRAWLRMIGIADEMEAFFALHSNFLRPAWTKLYD